VSPDVLAATNLRLSAPRRGNGWDVRLQASSAAAAAGVPSTIFKAYLTMNVDCGLGNPTDGVGEECARKYFALGSTAGVTCTATGLCEINGASVVPQPLAGKTLTTPARRSTVFVYLVTSAGGALSASVRLR
jgi:hypothetical protein